MLGARFLLRFLEISLPGRRGLGDGEAQGSDRESRASGRGEISSEKPVADLRRSRKWCPATCRVGNARGQRNCPRAIKTALRVQPLG